MEIWMEQSAPAPRSALRAVLNAYLFERGWLLDADVDPDAYALDDPVWANPVDIAGPSLSALDAIVEADDVERTTG